MNSTPERGAELAFTTTQAEAKSELSVAGAMASAPEFEPGPRPASLRRNSAARFLADGAGLVFGLGAAVITARFLGPEGKGLFSSLTFLAGLMMQTCSIGLGDAAIVLVGQKKATLQEAVSASIAAALTSSLLGALGMWSVGLLAFRRDWTEIRAAMLVACLGLPIAVCAYLLSFVLSAEERIVASSTVLATTSSVSTLGLLVFVALIELGVTGAAVATVLGSAAAFVVAASLVMRTGLTLRPRWNGRYMRAALRYGVSVEVSYIVTVMFLRVDLLLVYALGGSASAGQYSVGLTVAALVGLLPIAISNATFPRLANIDDVKAQELTAEAFRFGLTAALAAGLMLAVTVPVAIPLLFGAPFRPAVVPTLVLIPGAIAWSCQWLLCRAWAARGRTGLLIGSFSMSLVIMCALDYVLIPAFGIGGAALGSLLGPTAGLGFCMARYRRSPQWALPLRHFVPSWADFRDFVARSLSLVPVRRGRRLPTSVP